MEYREPPQHMQLIVLDPMLRIRHLTRKVSDVLPILQSDKGRFLTEFNISLGDQNVAQTIRRVMETKEPVTTTSADTVHDVSYLVRITPYLMPEGQVEGATITLTDISKEAALQDALRVKLVEAFAAAISNGDRHFGNLALFCDQLAPQAGCRLAPVYDMLPMDLAPSGGVVPPPKFGQPRPAARFLDVQAEAHRIAQGFFVRVAEDRRISQPMRDAAERAVGAFS